MKTQSEIAAKITEKDPDDFFGFRAEALLACLDFKHAGPWLKDDAYGFPIPESEDLARMMRGERCSATYDCGCGF